MAEKHLSRLAESGLKIDLGYASESVR